MTLDGRIRQLTMILGERLGITLDTYLGLPVLSNEQLVNDLVDLLLVYETNEGSEHPCDIILPLIEGKLYYEKLTQDNTGVGDAPNN